MKTIIPAHVATNIRLTTMMEEAFNVAPSLLYVSTAGREAGFTEPALAFWEKESAKRPFGPQPDKEAQHSAQIGSSRQRDTRLSPGVGPVMLSPAG
jgi:hypothetical protein